MFNIRFVRVYIIMLILLLSYIAFPLIIMIKEYRSAKSSKGQIGSRYNIYLKNTWSLRSGYYIRNKLGVTMAKFLGWTLTVAVAVLFIWFIKHLIVTYCIW